MSSCDSFFDGGNMSATGRNLPGAERHADDFYATPPWCVEALLRGSNLPSGRWLEPTAGDGAIVEEVLHHRIDVEWHLVESRAEELRVGGGLLSRLLKPDCPTDRVASVEIRDFLTMPAPAQPFDVALGNPPFNLALEVIQHALTMSSVVCMLLRINFLASQKRAAWMREHTPSIYVLPKRPSFTGGKTDATEYAWFCWDGKPSRVVIL
jgi:hypothetical protein